MSEGLIGRTLLHGEYRLTGILGRGGMATVYRAHSLSLDTDVAVKILAPRLAADPGFRERHHDEARSLAQLHHPNLVEVHHYGEEDDLVYIVLRLVPGGTLKNRLAAVGGALDLLTTARLISQVADALQLAHDRGLVHLDIKPANILLGRSDWPLLADFGITRAVKNVQSSHGTQRMAGTPLYMSPEQCRCGPVDGRSDQYSLASTAFELLTGRQPFQAETTEALLQHQIEDPPPRPREMNPGIPAPVEDVLLRALAKSPDDRYPSMRDFAAAFTDAAERTRAVSLETKAAVSGIAPNLLAVVALLLLGPLLVSLLPGGASLGTHLPLSWPFQLVVSILVAGLLLGMRWHLIGLLTRLLNSLFDTVLGRSSDVAGPGAQPPGPLAVKAWRNAIVGSVEGLLNLAYLLVVYRLIAVPALAAAGVFLDPAVDRFVATAVAIVVVVLALGIVVAIYRGGGPVVAGLTLGVCWAFANALPTADVATAGGLSLAWTVKAIVGVGVLVILLATRHPTQTLLRRLASGSLGPLVAELHAGATPEEVGLARRQIEGVIGAAIDFMYLVIGYALLRTPLTEGLQNLLGLAPAAILVSGVAALVWFLLTLRIRAIAGGAGLALAILLGAPLLVSLPFLESRILGATWPTTAAVWVVGTALVLTLAAVRGQVQRVGRQAFGPMIDRGLLGATPAPTEDHSQRRVGALGDVGGALLDVGYLVLAYWILGVPAAAAIGRTTGRAAVGSILLALLVLAAIAILLGPITRALLAVEETGGPPWSSRFRAVPAIAVALVALVIGGCAAAPLALAAPDVTGGIALQAPAASTVVVDWEHWLPWTP
ncbi:MAG TPA: serine/threonine-protein kinase, partial [Chloroflexota bacterium]|nr:serine/threonine-protein kinase [Chloroflexota bacterium]